jgi:hypothetical protein
MSALLAQINVARLLHPIDAPQTREFVAALDRINYLADNSPGFVWRFTAPTVHGHDPDDPLLVYNMSVWRRYVDLHAYVYRSAHGHFVRRRYEWFEKGPGPSTALWWVPSDHRPTLEEGRTQLRYLRTYGPTPQAFTVRVRFDADGRPERRYT